MSQEKYRGIFPAFYACYDDQGEVSAERTKALAAHFVKKGVKGVYVCGSSGECIYLDKEERKRTLEYVMEAAAGKLTVIAHVAANNTRDSRELAAHAQSLGADAIAAIPPIYFRLPEYSIADYWNAISSAAPDTDFIIYNIPQLAGTALTPSLLKKMLKNPRVAGVKNSSMPTQDIQIFKSLGGDRLTVFNGPDEQLLSGLAMGADGGIGGTYGAMPELYLQMETLVRDRRMDEAQKLQYAVNEIISTLCSGYGNMYGMIKEVLQIREGLSLGGVRAPLTGLAEGDLSIAQEAAKLIDRAIKAFC